ncbi:putative cysteine desulfurase [Rubripirellula amarantea]|uniref:cysteine desulfurase n=1 Tax=Rubripirellula amarantea TaxID=2527999 RepID=A0A5C5WVP5_9BACT|nr:aminotransferase class V-fold PLP-dependent enzyme [Rubripirellula amarantea]TWT54638.1 putative cysteine desulfurase [Rubripirellula amarantea]
MSKQRIYLDHAATSYPKANGVLEAMDHFARSCGATAGRGGYTSARTADQVVAKLRQKLAEFVGAESSSCISFHASGTAALNAAIQSTLRPGDHVVTTAAEHNSVLRPLHHLQKHNDVKLTIVPVDSDGLVDVAEVLAATTSKTRLVAVTSASNVTGCVEPIAEIGQRLKDRSAIFLCDAAQTLGVLPIDVTAMGIDLLAAPGHKGMGAPAGTAMLYANQSLHEVMQPIIQGGTGSQSESLDMPEQMPAKMEAGNLNIPALAGWLAAAESLNSDELERRRIYHGELAALLYDGLRQVDGVTLFGQTGPLPIASMAINGMDVGDLSMILDSDFSIETRSGYHCAALIHSHIGSSAGGTLRMSAGSTTTRQDIETAIDAVKVISTKMQEFSQL